MTERLQELYFRTWKDSIGHQLMQVEMGSFEPISERVEWLRNIGDAHASGPETRARLIAELEGIAASGYTHVSSHSGAWVEFEWAPYRVLPGYPAPDRPWCEAMVRLPRFRGSLLESTKLYQRIDRAVSRNTSPYYAWCDPARALAALGRMRARRCFVIRLEYSTWTALHQDDKAVEQWELAP